MSDDEGPLSHIARSEPPWRAQAFRTECGLPTEKHPVMTRDEAKALIKKHGKQRAAFLLCMNCCNRANENQRWEDNPAAVLARDLADAGNCRKWGRDRNARATAHMEMVEREVAAFTALIAAHRDEFDAMVEGLDDVTDLASIRKAKARRA